MKHFTIDRFQMSTLLLINAALVDIIDSGAVSDDVLEELEYLQPQLYDIFEKIDNK